MGRKGREGGGVREKKREKKRERERDQKQVLRLHTTRLEHLIQSFEDQI